jgi:hypothetical protein
MRQKRVSSYEQLVLARRQKRVSSTSLVFGREGVEKGIPGTDKSADGSEHFTIHMLVSPD